MDDQNRILAGLILSCKPEDLKAIAQKADGSLAVVAPNGMKFVFSPVELDNARDSFCLPNASIPARQKSPCGIGASSADGNAISEPVEASGYVHVVTSTGSVTGNPLASTSSANGQSEPNPPASIPARHKSPCGTGAGSATAGPHRRRKEKRL